MKALLLGAVIVIAVIAVTHHGSGDSSTGSQNAAAATSEPHVSVVAAESHCVATGVNDVYTGDGKVMFVFTLRNTGEAGEVNVTPVRHYSDGGINESAMDMMSVPVPAHAIRRGSSEQMTYKAHEHEIVSCGLRLDNGVEIPILATGI
jgi:hypothetical protein